MSQRGKNQPQDESAYRTARFGLLLTLLFTLLIATGTLLLLTPYATPHIFDATLDQYVPAGEPITFSEAFFTATSAVCLTGLTVRDTALGFTPFGQAVIGTLIQLGALGIITFGSILALRLCQWAAPSGNHAGQDARGTKSKCSILRLITSIVLATLAIELVGAALLYPMWDVPAGGTLTFSQRAGMSLFHAMSAYCNAGFDLTGHSLIGYRYAMLTHAVILPLIVVGGLGFPVLENILAVIRARFFTRSRNRSGKTTHRLTVHTKLVLTTTACLYLYGVVTIGTGQMMPYLHESMQQGVTAHAQRPDPLTPSTVGSVLADASFLSVTSRTAGFNAMPMDELRPASLVSVMTMMLVGGSPGSAAGGLKTTVVALLVISTVATLRNRSGPRAFDRALPGTLARQATALGLCYLLLVTLSTFLLCLSEPFTFQALMFEAVSASTNTGLSLGITPDLSGFGRAVIVTAMLLGRICPLLLVGRMVFAGSSEPSSHDSVESIAFV